MATTNSIELITTTEVDGEPKDRVTCRLCRRQFAKYTCPTCNVPYCSLTCFRSQAHNQCSEGFYKKEIEEDIHAGPSKSTEERKQMMDLLRKFEEESQESSAALDGDGDEASDEEDPTGLATRFGAIDLDSASHEVIWSMLTAEERKKFMKAFEDPTSELAQQLLASEQLEREIQEPWWEATDLEDGNSRTFVGQFSRYGEKPKMMHVPSSMIKAIPSGHPLVYNMCAICIVYAYITRHLGTSPLGSIKSDDLEYRQARELVSRFLPFLTDRRSTKLYPDLPSVFTEIWSLFDLGKMTSELFSLLLQDATKILRPLRVVEVAPSEQQEPGKDYSIPPSHPHSMSILVLSDLRSLFSAEEQGHHHVAHKLLFYAAHMISTPSLILEAVTGEMTTRAGQYGFQQGGLKI